MVAVVAVESSTASDYRAAQSLLWGSVGAWGFDAYASLNRRYFADGLPAWGVLWGLTPQNSLSCTDSQGRITLSPALLDPQDPYWRRGQPYRAEGFALDVLVHEMIHSLLRVRSVASGRDGDHNLAEWCEQVTRLAPVLGLGRVQAQPIKSTHANGKAVTRPLNGYLSRQELAGFPWSLRR